MELELVVLDRLMKTTSKKKVDNFVRKIAPARENPGYAYGWKINQHMADWVDKH